MDPRTATVPPRRSPDHGSTADSSARTGSTRPAARSLEDTATPEAVPTPSNDLSDATTAPDTGLAPFDATCTHPFSTPPPWGSQRCYEAADPILRPPRPIEHLFESVGPVNRPAPTPSSPADTPDPVIHSPPRVGPWHRRRTADQH
ncbi:hypothetical protein GCM10012275_32700 [Longimycelium tulufanense]|uniref:Uncharacterized protein n=1 Tax=Longimycelium tulufanense TaxID=907463 RepID=A0A8J3CCI2_9PSEU|nr:hypothetical protein GCM10012275_32700 [Longimycelium tulufanense]